MSVSVSVVGATGYAGGELIRYLAQHPSVEIASLHGRDREGQPLANEHPNLAPLNLILKGGEPEPGIDVAFLALPSGHSAELAVRLSEGGTTVIDIGSDLRLRDASAYDTWYRLDHPAPQALQQAVYGLTERVRDRLPGAKLIANPGCYPTAALLALAPLAAAGLINRVIVDAKSGVSGAGRGAGSDFLFTELEGGTKAYGLAGHRHQPEIEQGLADAGAAEAQVTFVPHLVPQTRGILATCYVDLAEDASPEALTSIFTAAYEGEPFVHVVDTPPSTKLTWGTNHAFVHIVRLRERQAIAVCVIDNMGKGAAGQAIQNMNVALGLPETAGLTGLAVHP
jgi:N-acetyl-gamma-glutamyl-phosphate reductase